MASGALWITPWQRIENGLMLVGRDLEARRTTGALVLVPRS